MNILDFSSLLFLQFYLSHGQISPISTAHTAPGFPSTDRDIVTSPQVQIFKALYGTTEQMLKPLSLMSHARRLNSPQNGLDDDCRRPCQILHIDGSSQN
jgi:hypothetical protein